MEDHEVEDSFTGEPYLETLTKKELIAKIAKLVSSNKILKRQIDHLKWNSSENNYRKPNQRPFDFSSCSHMKIALKIAYLGWNYQGFANQDNTPNTVEHELFAALKKTCLIEDHEKCNYSRCGRTDKGVSAFGQVISLKVRGNKEHQIDVSLNYAKILNRVLPPDIRILAWTTVPDEFDARFSCISRTYKYYFPVASLDVEIMKTAAKKLIGEHDFRNFCKVDVGNNVNHFIRHIQDIQIGPMPSQSMPVNGCAMYEITIQGMAFLWHQVRCMVSVLFMIGMHLEEPAVVERLLDISHCPKKPQYSMVSEIPLILYDCTFESINWYFAPGELAFTSAHFQSVWTDLAVRKAVVDKVLSDCRALQSSTSSYCEDSLLPLIPGHKRKNYRSLMTRPVCDGIDRHLEKQAIKRKRLEDRKKRSKPFEV